ncbi:hypothetical protein [Comamonas testosteroni]|uniref:hypothetical protein n=1 Tax=Comamonas testosteroni TaxID=285 RepID=UPI0006B88233|nr:hypothetical protein [Comamonas testosteroni]
MSLDATHSRLTKVGRIVIEAGHVLVEGFDGDNCSCRDVAVLACMHGMEVLALEARKTIEQPGGGQVVIG